MPEMALGSSVHWDRYQWLTKCQALWQMFYIFEVLYLQYNFVKQVLFCFRDRDAIVLCS